MSRMALRTMPMSRIRLGLRGDCSLAHALACRSLVHKMCIAEFALGQLPVPESPTIALSAHHIRAIPIVALLLATIPAAIATPLVPTPPATHGGRCEGEWGCRAKLATPSKDVSAKPQLEAKWLCMYVCMYICMYACMHTCTYVCMYVCVYVCVYVCMYVCMYVCIYVCMYVCLYVCMYVCMYECICM